MSPILFAALDAGAVRLGEERGVERCVDFPAAETAKRSEGHQRLLDRTVAREAAQMPLQLSELCRTGRRSPVRHVHDLSAFDVERTGPSACGGSTFALFNPSGEPRGGSRTSGAALGGCRASCEFPRRG